MAGTAYGQVIDYLFTGTIQDATKPLYGQTLLQQLQQVDSRVVLTDNLYAAGENLGGETAVAIGRESIDAATSRSTRVNVTMGGGSIDETFDLPIFILSRGNGPQQKPIRDVAIGLFNAIAHWVQQDLTLGGALLGGRYAVISDFTVTQTETVDTDGASLQDVEILVTLHCPNHYIP